MQRAGSARALDTVVNMKDLAPRCDLHSKLRCNRAAHANDRCALRVRRNWAEDSRLDVPLQMVRVNRLVGGVWNDVREIMGMARRSQITKTTCYGWFSRKKRSSVVYILRRKTSTK